MLQKKMNKMSKMLVWSAISFVMTGCGSQIKNAGGVPAFEEDPRVAGAVTGVGVESQDILAMTDKMLRDLLATPVVISRQKAPRIIIDDSDFKNESSQPINKKLIINKLRVDLNRSANGKIKFIGRDYASSVERERQLKREGVTDTGTTGLTKAQSGADFKLVGSIASLDSFSGGSGMHQRYTQVTFEMLDLETSEIVWSNNYEFERAGSDDAIYR